MSEKIAFVKDTLEQIKGVCFSHYGEPSYLVQSGGKRYKRSEIDFMTDEEAKFIQSTRKVSKDER